MMNNLPFTPEQITVLRKQTASSGFPQITRNIENAMREIGKNAIPNNDDRANLKKEIERLRREKEHRDAIEEAKRRERVAQMFDRETLFRFAYVPFVIAELVWDYADTVIIAAINLGQPETRKLSRAIRDARREYEHLRYEVINNDTRNREIENGYVFEDAVNDITRQMLLNVRLDINSEYPDLEDKSRDLLLSVYQCYITSRALLKYLDRESAKVEKRVGHRIGRMLPPPYYVMDALIPEFIGDKPASDKFKKLMQTYIDTFANQIALIELNDVSPEE